MLFNPILEQEGVNYLQEPRAVPEKEKLIVGNDVMDFLLMIWDSLVRAAQEATPLILQGLRMTVMVSVTAIAIGVAIGLVTCLLRMTKIKVFRFLAGAYIWVIRGTPMLVQAYFIHFGVAQLIAYFVPGFIFTILQSAIITCSLNAGAYLAEVLRGGIGAVPRGQAEAARSLGMGYGRTMWRIVLPQAIKISIPAMVNQFIITIKDTSILSAIGLADMTNRTKAYVGVTYNSFGGWFYVGFFYLALISILMIISMRVEARLNYDRKN